MTEEEHRTLEQEGDQANMPHAQRLFQGFGASISKNPTARSSGKVHYRHRPLIVPYRAVILGQTLVMFIKTSKKTFFLL
jgi:hypothetical protein